MAAKTIGGFPAGASVSAYARASLSPSNLLTPLPPSGTPVETETAGSDGRVAFSALAAGTDYVASDGSRVVSFETDDASPSSAASSILGATDASASSLARDGFLAAYDGTLAKFVGKAPSGTFRVRDEGAMGDGAVNDADPFRNALVKAMAVQAAGGVGILEANPTKTYKLATPVDTGSPTVVLAGAVSLPSTAGWLMLRGHGATLRLSGGMKTLFSSPSAGLAAGATVRNLVFDDWVLDVNNQFPASAIGIFAHIFAQYLNVDRLVFRNITTINGGAVSLAARAFNIGSTRTDLYGTGGQATNTLTNILADNLDIGAYGGSGGGGFNVVTFCNQAKNPADIVDQPLPRAAAVIENVTIRHSRYESGSRAVQGGVTGFFAGGDGWSRKVLVDDCWAAGSGDDNYEFPGALSLEIRRCTGIDGYFENFMFSNNYGGTPWGEEQHVILRSCKSITQTPGTCVGGAVQANYMNGGNGGRVTLDDVDVILALDDFSQYVSGNPSPLILIQGSPRHLDVKARATIRTNDASTTAALQTIGMALRPRGQACSVRGHFESEITGSYAGAAGLNWQHYALQATDSSLLNLDDLSIDVRQHAKPTGAGKINVTLVNFGTKGQLKEPFTTVGNLAYILKPVNATTLADLTETGTVVQAAANPTTAKQLRLVEFTGSGDNFVGRTLDTSVFIGGAYQQQAGFRLGWRLRASKDGLSGIDVYITDDGVNSTLKIDEVIGGTATNRDTFNLGARVADQAAFGIRARVQGDTVTLDYFTATTSPAFTATGVTTRSVTSITNAQLSQVGAMGYSDIVWTPMTLTANIDNLTYDTMPVITGRLALNLLSNREAVNQLYVLNFTNDDTRIRIDGRLRVRGNMRRARWATTPKDINTTGTATKQIAGTVLDAYQPAVVPAAKTGTTWTVGAYGGSGAGSYSCPGPWPEDARGVLAAGATTPFAEVSRDGGATFTQIAFAASEKISERLMPGDVLRFTGAVPASLNLVPVQ